MESDADSEYDRRAYGQYTSLAAEGDSDIDEEAASYLRSVRCPPLPGFQSGLQLSVGCPSQRAACPRLKKAVGTGRKQKQYRML